MTSLTKQDVESIAEVVALAHNATIKKSDRVWEFVKWLVPPTATVCAALLGFMLSLRQSVTALEASSVTFREVQQIVAAHADGSHPQSITRAELQGWLDRMENRVSARLDRIADQVKELSAEVNKK